MKQILTITATGEIDLGKGVHCSMQEYTDEEVAKFFQEAAQWELQAERDILFVEWHDTSVYNLLLTPNMFVVDRGVLVGLYYDSCYFAFADTDTHEICNPRPDYRNIGHNFIGCVYYSLRHRPDNHGIGSD